MPDHLFRRYCILLCILLLLASCTGSKSHEQAQRYQLKGTIVAVDKAHHQVVINHEAIPGYMEGMTMPYTLKDDAAYDVMRPGDQIQATLAVAGERAWLEDPIITQATPGPAKTTTAPTAAVEPQPGTPLPTFTLTNQDGQRITLEQYRSRALLLTFIYTRCPLPDFCTRMSTNFAALNRAISADADLRAHAHLLSITLDPAYDTPKVLRSYGAAHTENYEQEQFDVWELATGRPEEIKRLAEFCGLTYMQEDGDQIVHSLRTVLVGPDGKLVKIYRGNDWKPEDVLNDLRALLAGKQVSPAA